MHWRGILMANGSSAPKFNSNEYVKLVEPLKRLDYAISFHNFPDLQPVLPFAGWIKADPTDSLEWYAAYHGVKHNREGEFQRSTTPTRFRSGFGLHHLAGRAVRAYSVERRVGSLCRPDHFGLADRGNVPPPGDRGGLDPGSSPQPLSRQPRGQMEPYRRSLSWLIHRVAARQLAPVSDALQNLSRPIGRARKRNGLPVLLPAPCRYGPAAIGLVLLRH
jgi:hypothetical protein